MEFKDSQTAGNLMKAFAGESQARNRYTFYSKIAMKEGYQQIGGIFLETAGNEQEHAKLFFKALLKHGMNEQVVEINGAGYPVAMDSTLKNLDYAANGEKEEWSELYPHFAEVALAEGYPDVATLFKLISAIEKHHEERYRKLWNNVKDLAVFKKDGKVFWQCRKCGHIVSAIEAPEECPVCAHPKAYFEILTENY
ncbi:MAG: rubrerythrin family protein [Candidatus Cloacimonetes bacterium]|nr:rubrerythrin family protein [Candidatus Cloacimonadota bacterium]